MRRRELERTIAEGLAQTRGYLDRCGAEAGHLILFDRSPDRPREERIFRRQAPAATEPPTTVWGMGATVSWGHTVTALLGLVTTEEDAGAEFDRLRQEP